MSWSPCRRIAFRIAAVFSILLVLPFPLGIIPGTEGLHDLVAAPFREGVFLLARVLGLPRPALEHTGSGDTLFAYLRLLLITIAAVGGGLAWSAFARASSYPRLAAALRVWLRYWLGLAMIAYGLVKLFPLQFDLPRDLVFDQRVGDKSPMGLLWLFMGYSQPYTIFAGVCELGAGLLLVWRRTATIGALASIAVMTNIVAMNFCYDVPVKLYSLELLIVGIAIAAPDLRRLITAALGRATPEVSPRARSSPAIERARLVIKLVVLASFAAGWTSHLWRLDRPPASELAGAWDVTSFALDGADRPPLVTDRERWQRIVFARDTLAIRFMPETRAFYRATVDEAHKLIEIPIGVRREDWGYARPDPTHLVLDGALDGHRYHVLLERAPAPLLETRGFHWIQEAPFHR